MFNRFTKGARGVVEDAVEIARELGASQTEAEHLLLAAARRDDPTAVVLRGHGLDYDGLEAALEAETGRSLAAVGVSAERPRFSPFPNKPRFATSAKSALEGALKAATERSDRHIGSGHVVLGVLRPTRGTVPRALGLAGVDQEELRQAVSTVA
ncbi:hypothetical protein OJ997_33630 [Solirubrobacter phytolaccae]|uniref:Clp R domain-containing protein n=1 Tax=Solirubrobacter phytolaccae TaxID=1404360 RepID=A0A9X3NI03_9ACTN|nr:Clp protease N-terminal domain-containing protein [Solirubrobacter phytolaccae]MDA0185295.1 hypothetical protein [Solirubrobacter phytolaccae]